MMKNQGGGTMEKVKTNVLQNIENSFDKLHEAEKKVAKVILDNPSKILSMNISELSDLCGVSDATVVRMAQHLGYKGYHQMRLLLSKDKGFRFQEEGEDLKDPIDYYFKGELSYLNSLLDQQNKESIDKVVELIKKSESIIVIGMGNALPIALDLDFRLNRLGFRSFSSSLYESTMNYINNSPENSVLIAISKSGISTRVIDAIGLARKKNLKVISIVGDLSSPVAKESDLYIYSGKMGRFVRNIQPGIESYIGEHFINDLLIMGLAYYQSKNKPDYSTELEIELSSNKL